MEPHQAALLETLGASWTVVPGKGVDVSAQAQPVLGRCADCPAPITCGVQGGCYRETLAKKGMRLETARRGTPPKERATDHRPLIVATQACRQPGCDQPRRYDRGAGGGYCETHGRPRFQAIAHKTNVKRYGEANAVTPVAAEREVVPVVQPSPPVTAVSPSVREAAAGLLAAFRQLLDAGERELRAGR